MIKFIRKMGCGAACFGLSGGVAGAWRLEEAAKPYKGTEISVIFLDRPGYRAIMKMLPDFEQKTGIKVKYEIVPYESTLEKEVRDFSSNGDLTIALVDLVWIGTFADSDYIVPIEDLKKQLPNIFDPYYDISELLHLLHNAFSSWSDP